MLLYTEEQLEQAYKTYRLHQVKQDLGFLSLKHFRILYEQLAEEILEGSTGKQNYGFSLWNNYYAWFDFA